MTSKNICRRYEALLAVRLRKELRETISVLLDQETMRSIARGLEDFEKGRTRSLEEVRKHTGT